MLSSPTSTTPPPLPPRGPAPRVLRAGRPWTRPFDYAIYDCFSDSIVYGGHVGGQESEEAMPPRFDRDGHYFGIRFPDRRADILMSLDRWLLASILQLLVLGTFVYAVVHCPAPEAVVRGPGGLHQQHDPRIQDPHCLDRIRRTAAPARGDRRGRNGPQALSGPHLIRERPNAPTGRQGHGNGDGREGRRAVGARPVRPGRLGAPKRGIGHALRGAAGRPACRDSARWRPSTLVGTSPTSTGS